MPKRKRELDDTASSSRTTKSRRQSPSDYYNESKKNLHRALKSAKNFERQKLGRRLKLAKAKAGIPEIERINREIEFVKVVDLDKLTASHLNKSLLKVKTFNDCDKLPADVRVEVWKPDGTEEVIAAARNVMSGMCNMRQVKEVMEGIVEGMYDVLGVKQGAKDQRAPQNANTNLSRNGLEEETDNEEDSGQGISMELVEPVWEGFSSSNDLPEGDLGSEENEEGGDVDDGEDSDNDLEYQSLSDTEINRYENLLGENSSSDAASDDDVWARIRASIAKDNNPRPPSISLSPEPQGPSDHDSSDAQNVSDPEAGADAIPQPNKAKSKSQRAPIPSHTKTSTFLPTLMGGYWSCTESSASDLEDTPAGNPIRKNRPGQAARRAIWEKKYKSDANHIKSGQGSVKDKRDAGWDAKRGAQDVNGRRARRGGAGFGSRGRSGVTGGNATVVTRNDAGGKGSEKKQVNEGPLHPSWQAAKKAKTLEKTAKFEGKKMTFD